MKKRILFLALILAVCLSPVVHAQDDGSATTATSSVPAGGDENAGDSGQHTGKWRQAFAQLGLTDAQKQQIQQIRANTQPGKERRQQIMAVLTSDQKQKLKSMFEQYHSQQSGQ